MATNNVMQRGKLSYNGIARSVSDQLIKDGYLDELINLRFWKGKLQPVGNPVKLHNLPVDSYNKVWLHDQDGIFNYVGMDENGNLRLINMGTGAGTIIHNYASSVQVQFLKRFMIVIYDGGMDVYIWNNADNKYDAIIMPSRPMLFYTTAESKLVTTEETTGASAVLGKYYKSLNEQSKDNFHTGGIMLRAAFRMFDGSYVLHSIPEMVKLGNHLSMYMTERSVDGGGEENDPNAIKYWASKLQVGLNKLHYMNIDKNIFTSVCIFACRNEELYDISEETITDDVILEKVKANDEPNRTVDINFHDIFEGEISEDFKNMVDSPSWYMVHEFDLEDIAEMPSGPVFETIDLKDFYQDYATREALTVDQFSHHKLDSSFSYNYNSRLIIGDVTTTFGSYQYFPLNPATLVTDSMIHPDGYQYFVDRYCKLVVTINTSSGDITKVVDVGLRPFSKYQDKEWLCISRGVLGYPDARAKKITLLIEQGSNWHKIQEFKLEKAVNGNYAYYHSDNFSSDPDEINDFYVTNFNYLMVGTDYPASSIVNINEYVSEDYKDENRIQISELNNPFLYPAENSYQVGTGRVLNAASNTVPLSSGQFGEHPLIIFTTKGRFAMYQGPNDVLFQNIKPLDGDVPEDALLITPVATGVVYTTATGLYIAVGTNVTDLSEQLYGSPNFDLQGVENYSFRLEHLQLVSLSNSLSTVDARLYLLGASIGYNHEYKELLVTNSNYNYSYVYSFKSSTWHKIARSFKLLINAYPFIYGIAENTANDGVFNLSEEHFNTDIHTLVATRPCKVNDNVDFVLIHRIIQRCVIETSANCYAGFYVFGSNDLHTWQLMQGSDKKTGTIVDLFCTRSHLKVKYLIFVFASTLKEGSAVNNLDIQYYFKLQNKIR